MAAATGKGVLPLAGLLILVSGLAAAHRFLLRWDVLVAFLVVVVLVIPIKRYEFAVSLPFDLEPYRIALAILLGLWVAALLADPGVELRGTDFDKPLGLFALAVVASVALNPQSIQQLDLIRSFVGSDAVDLIRDTSHGLPYRDVSGTVTKALLFLVSVYLAYYLIVSVVRTPAAIHAVLKTLVLGASGVAFFAIVERRSGYNVFDHLQGWIPLISFEGSLDEEGIARAGRLRVYASAQHPIALAGVFVMVLPLSGYLAYHTRRFVWYATSVLLLLGALATISRTSVTMLSGVAIVFFFLRREAVKRLAVFVLPALIAIHLLLPGTIGGLRQAFFPSQGLLSDQTVYGGRASPTRLQPQFEVIEQQPAFGQGYGTRITSGPDQNARVLDNQWLATAVETGLVGVAAWLWLFVRFVRRTGRVSKRDPSDRGWLLAALAGSVVAFAIGMLTFDAFAFIQALFIFFVILALGASVLAWNDAWPEGARRVPKPDPAEAARRTLAASPS